MTKIQMTVEVNGTSRTLVVEPRTTLADALRDELGLTGTRGGCDEGVLSTSVVHVDGEPVHASLMFAVQAHGKEVVTIEGLGRPGALHPVQQAFVDAGGVGCGFCTPGLVMLTAGALAREPELHEAELVRLAAASPCGCTSPDRILGAMRDAQAAVRTRPE